MVEMIITIGISYGSTVQLRNIDSCTGQHGTGVVVQHFARNSKAAILHGAGGAYVWQHALRRYRYYSQEQRKQKQLP